MARVTQSRVEIRWSIEKEGARPNGLHYDPASDQLLIVDQGDGDLITIDDPRGARRESVFQAKSGKPSGVVRTDFGGQDTIFMASTYNLALTQVRGDEAVEVDVRGVGTGIVDFAEDLVNGTHTGYHGLEWDGEYLWASSPPGKAIFKMKLEDSADGTAVSECTWFPVAFGNRPHGLAWADDGTLWVADTSAGTISRLDAETGRVWEVIRVEAPVEIHGLTIHQGVLWYCDAATCGIGQLYLD